MTIETFFALLMIAAAGSGSPGPNNLMLASSGVNFGFRRSLPHMAGVAFGFPVMILMIGFGLGEIFRQSHDLREVARWLGAALLLWFAWRIATSGRAKAKRAPRPFTFFESAGFQWINPKGWAMALATTSQFVTGQNVLREAAICAGAYILTGMVSTTSWTLFGVSIRRFLNDDLRLRIFNISMGLMIAAFAVLLMLARG